MKLEDITAEIRPRSEWEAVDLGLSLTRTYLRDLVKSWLSFVVPVCLLIIAFSYRQPAWAIFLMWWLKPLFERVALFDLSRRLFGAVPDSQGRFQSWRYQLRKQWLLILMGVGLTVLGAYLHRAQDDEPAPLVFFWILVIGLGFYRSGIARSLVLPVKFLENLKGGAYRQRKALLSRRAAGIASVLTLLCILVEISLVYWLMDFIEMLMPSASRLAEAEDRSLSELAGEMLSGEIFTFSPVYLIGICLIYLVAMSLTAWLYVGAGFGLYLNTRTWTEGWDIELSFRRLGQRLSVILLIGFFSGAGLATSDAQSSSERLEEILRHEDFEIHRDESRKWVPKEKEDRKKSKDQRSEAERHSSGETERYSSGETPLFLVNMGKAFFWIIIILLVGFLIWSIAKNLHTFKKNGSTKKEAPRRKVTSIAGMEITPESLPDDVISTARHLWSQGQEKEALGLLYRASIGWLVEEDVVEIQESDTELDCVRRMKREKGSSLTPIFEKLTRHWMGAAYGGRFPADHQMEEVFTNWPFQGRRPS